MRQEWLRWPAALAAGLALITGCSGSGRPPAHPSGPPAARPTQVAGAPASASAHQSQTARTSILTPVGSVALGFQPAGLVLAGSTVYAFGWPAGGATQVVRIDLAAGAVSARARLPGCVRAASVANGPLAVLSGPSAADGCLVGDRLWLLDPANLAVRTARAVPASSDVLARPDGVYVSQRGRVSLYAPETLALLSGFAVEPSDQSGIPGGALGADPRSTVLWVGIPNGRHPVVEAISLVNHRLLGIAKISAVEEGSPQGAGDDSWVIFATGMLSEVELVAPDGRQLAAVGQVGPNSTTEQVTGRHLWTYYDLGDGSHLTCRSLATGAAQGSETVGGSGGPAFGADNTHVYLASGTTLDIYKPAGVCT